MAPAGNPEDIKLLDRVVAAAEAGDPSDLLDVYATNAVIWHNTDDREQTVQANMKVLVAMDRFLTNRRYTDRRIHTSTAVSFTSTLLRGTKRSTGEDVALKACVVIADRAHLRPTSDTGRRDSPIRMPVAVQCCRPSRLAPIWESIGNLFPWRQPLTLWAE